MQQIFTFISLKAWQFMLIALFFFSSKSFAQKDSWTLLQSSDSSITPRAGTATFTIGNKAYIGTGSTNTGLKKDLWEYDATQNTWAQKANFGGVARQYAVAFSIAGKGYLGTGMGAGGTNDVYKDFWQYDPTSNSWIQKADLSGAKRFEAVGFAINGKGYISTGYDWFIIKNDTWEYDPLTDKWTFKDFGITPRFSAVSFTIGDKAYIGTGLTSFNQVVPPSAEFWEIDPSNVTSKKITDFAGGPTYRAAAFSLGDKGYVATGFSSTNALWQYNPSADRWLRKANFPGIDRTGGIGFTVGENGYLGLGRTSTALGDIWKYQLARPNNLKAIYSGRNFINLDWDNSSSSVGSTVYDVFVDGVKKYTTAESAITADNLLSNTSYSFSVKGRDALGNFSFPSNTVITKTTEKINGLNYRYYNGTWDTLPNFNLLTPVKSGIISNIDLNLRPQGVADNFGVVWEGYINIPTPGNYTFETISDDGSKFYFNSFYSPGTVSLVNNDNVHAPWPAKGNIMIAAAGLYPVSITFFEKNGGETMQVYWTGPSGSGITRQLIPDSAFTENFTSSLDTIAPSAPANLKILSASRNLISLNWDNSTDNIGVTRYDVYVNGTKKYSTGISEIIIDSLTENTAYSFAVRAVDVAENSSAFSEPATGKTRATNNGLNYRYYEGAWNSLPDFNLLTPVNTGITPNVNLSIRPAGVNNNFGFVWEGFINITSPGNYIFETVSDDGSRLYFNSIYSPTAKPLVDNDGVHAPWPVTGSVYIPAAGAYPISMTFFEKDGGETMQVYWTGPASSGITRQLIPESAFSENLTLPIDTIAPGAPVRLNVIAAARNFISLDWNNPSDSSDIIKYEVYVNGIKKYSTGVTEIIVDGLLANTTYTFMVKAVDIAGNISAFSNPVTGNTGNASIGLSYRYYEGVWSSLPDFNALVPAKTGLTPNVDISVKRTGINDNYGFVWEGYINIPTAGDYIFETVSDDGSKLYFNTLYAPAAIPLVNNDGLHAAWPATGIASIATAGVYPISITFFEKDGGEKMQVYWTGPAGSGITRQLIPNAAFTGNYAPALDTVAPGAPLNLRAITINSNDLHLDWDDAIDDREVARYDVYVGNVKQYTTTTSSIVAGNLYPNLLYTITVKAIDQTGNISPFSQELTVRTANTTNGLDYKYFEGDWDALPNFYSMSPVKSGSSPNVDINVRPAGRNDHFSILWEGFIYIPTPGKYTFETISDDGSKLYLYTYYYPGIVPLVSNDGLHASTSSSGTIEFTSAKAIPITITYFEKDGGEKMEVYWTGPGIPRQLIPNSAFIRDPGQLPVQNSSSMTVEALSYNPDSNQQKENDGITKIYPNPFSENFNLEFINSISSNKISVGIYDLTGRLVFDRYVGNLSTGKNTVGLHVSDGVLSPGVYLIGLKVNGKIWKTLKLVKSKR